LVIAVHVGTALAAPDAGIVKIGWNPKLHLIQALVPAVNAVYAPFKAPPVLKADPSAPAPPLDEVNPIEYAKIMSQLFAIPVGVSELV
jgi:hypothetical protein